MEERGNHKLWPLHIFIDLRKKKKMAAITLEQQVITVGIDEDMNTLIEEQNTEGWNVVSLTLFHDDSSVIILFTRITPTA